MNPTLYLVIVVTLGILAWLLRLWLQNTVQEAVKLGFAKELEETKLVLAKELEQYKAQLKRHDQATLVAALLARRVGGSELVQGTNRQIWEAQLWLPAPIAQRLSTVLVEDASYPAVKDLLAEVRKLIHGQDDQMTAEQFTHTVGNG